MIISQSFLICKLEIMDHSVLVRTKYEERQGGNQHKKAFLIIVVVDTIAIIFLLFSIYFPYAVSYRVYHSPLVKVSR